MAQTPTAPEPPPAPPVAPAPAEPPPASPPPAAPAPSTTPTAAPSAPSPPPSAAPAPIAPGERVIEERVVEERLVYEKDGKEVPVSPKPREPREEDGAPKEDVTGQKWVYVIPDIGFSYINLKSFSQENLALIDTEESGAMAGIGAGVRLLFVTLGLRARHHFAMAMWQVMAELQIHLKFGRVDPYFGLRAGYDSVGTFNQALGNATDTAKVDVSGFNVGPALGLDVFVADSVTLGFEGSADFLFLERPLPPLPAGLTPAQQAAIRANPLYQNAGSSVGFGGVLAGRLGFQF